MVAGSVLPLNLKHMFIFLPCGTVHSVSNVILLIILKFQERLFICFESLISVLNSNVPCRADNMPDRMKEVMNKIVGFQVIKI